MLKKGKEIENENCLGGWVPDYIVKLIEPEFTDKKFALRFQFVIETV